MILGAISSETEKTLLRAFGPDLDQAALQALAIEGYRTARLTAGEVAVVLGLPTSIAAREWLASRCIPLNYELEDLEDDRATLAELFPETGEFETGG